ncbi:MAG: hypothetical protein AAFO02_22485 [Bacteroidota bacterium]
MNFAKEIKAYTNGAVADLGGLTSYYSLGVDYESILKPERVYAHEIGHTAGLMHPGQLFSLLFTQVSFEEYKAWESEFFPNGENLLFDGTRDDGGLILEEHQILQIESLFNRGLLNQGTNEFNTNEDLKNTTRGAAKDERTDYIYDPQRND